jgi:hypothetical protein
MVLLVFTSAASSFSVEKPRDIYRNTEYGFYIEFPENWECKRGRSPTTVVTASSKDNQQNILIKVRELPPGYQEMLEKMDLSIYDIFDNPADIIPDSATLIAQGKTRLANQKAVWVRYSAPFSNLGIDIFTVQQMYALVYNSKMFFIISGTCGRSLKEASLKFSQSEGLFLNTLVTFGFFFK